MPRYIPNPVARLRYNYSQTQGSFVTLYGSMSEKRDSETGLYLDMHRRIHLIVQGKHNSAAGYVDNWQVDTIEFPAEADDVLIVLAFENDELLGMATYQIIQLSEKLFGSQQVLSLVHANIPVELECFPSSDESMQRWREKRNGKEG